MIFIVEEENIPFDKEHIKAQIEGGGGVVLDKFVLRLVRFYVKNGIQIVSNMLTSKPPTK